MENNQTNEIAIVPINWEVADEKTLGRKKAVSISFNLIVPGLSADIPLNRCPSYILNPV